ncbi:hypothetical protein [Rubrivirga sp.]|uniref:hypothetical protein n=1 Tax=Rubrivirga sp. TaxID=1885344 RepID=UPI003C78DFC7
MRFLPLCLTLGLLLPVASAQRGASIPPRIGVGFEATTALFAQDVIPTYPSLGLRGRVALPVNADVSLAASVGVGAHLFEGRRETEYVVNPQVEVIVTLPENRRGAIRYAFGGFGGFLPLDDGGGGPSLHGGYGWAIPLRETSAFAEINPSIVIGESDVTPVIALRGGVIF